MNQETTSALLAGGFALTGGLGGALVSGFLTRRADDRKVKAEDDRRWLTDRRTTYAAFLGLAEAMLREIDNVAVHLSYDGTKQVADEDEERLSDGLTDYFIRWETDLQPALGEVELLASPDVADLADRATAALMDVTAYVELRQSFTEYYPTWFQTRDLLDVLRNAMRAELGLPTTSVDERTANRRSDDWPWLPDRPKFPSYIQKPRHVPPDNVDGS